MNVNFYKIVCNNTGAIYVGSTCKTIQQRLQEHEYDYRRYLNGIFRFITSFIILENKNYSIELIDSVFCNDRKHRDTLERLHILNNSCINKNQPGREHIEWRSDNKEKLREYQKQYREDNKEQGKQYYQENKEQIREQQKQYRKDNKEKRNEKINCSCGGSYTLNNKARHLKSNKHLNYLTSL